MIKLNVGRILILLAGLEKAKREDLTAEEVAKNLRHLGWSYSWDQVRALFPRQYRRGFNVRNDLVKGRIWAAADVLQNLTQDVSGYCWDIVQLWLDDGSIDAFFGAGQMAVLRRAFSSWRRRFVASSLWRVAEAIGRGEDADAVVAHLKTMGWNFTWDQFWGAFWAHAYLCPDLSQESGLARGQLWAAAGLLMDLTSSTTEERELTFAKLKMYLELGKLDSFLDL